MGRYSEAYEWIKNAFEYHEGKGSSLMFSAKAEILIKLNRFEEVEELLDQAMKLAIASGNEQGIGTVHRVHGIYEAEKGHWAESMSHLEESYSFLEKTGAMIHHNSMLTDLARVEIMQSLNSTSEKNVDNTGPWLHRLEEHAQKYKLPGIRMRSALLKAELMESRGNSETAREILEEALTILDSPSVQTLRNEIQERLRNLN